MESSLRWRTTIALLCVFVIVGCSDPERRRFVQMCTEKGDTAERCSCAFYSLKAEVGDIDAEFVDFVIDFAKWNVKQGESGLDREQLMEKYDLDEAEFVDLATIVGGNMIRALNECK